MMRLVCNVHLLCRLKAVLNARTVEQYVDRLDQLKTSDEWIQDLTLQNWLEKKWIPQHKVAPLCCLLTCLSRMFGTNAVKRSLQYVYFFVICFFCYDVLCC